MAEPVVVETIVKAPPEAVFRALTDTKFLAQWWGSAERYTTSNWEMELHPGGRWSCRGQSARGDYSVGGVILEVSPPYRLAYTWKASWSSERETEVVFHLTPAEQGTLVRVTHSGFSASSGESETHRHGWEEVLKWLVSAVNSTP